MKKIPRKIKKAIKSHKRYGHSYRKTKWVQAAIRYIKRLRRHRPGFSSRYELMHYLCYAFLKVADPDNLDKVTAAWKGQSIIMLGIWSIENRL